MISVVLMEPEKEENIGRVARVMKNFGYTDLVLVNPKANHLGNKAMALASHANDLLQSAKVISKKGLEGFDYLVGTTAILGADSNITRVPILPKEAARIISKKNLEIGLVFGRESSGLSNEELKECDMLISIPTAPHYSTMNLSQAVGIVLYEVFVACKEKNITSHIPHARKLDKDILLSLINSMVDGMNFPTQEKKETQKKVWKRVVGKSLLTKKEFMALMGFFKKVNGKR